MRAMRLAMVSAVLALACAPPPSDGGVATIQSGIISSVDTVEDFNLIFGLDANTYGPAFTGLSPGLSPWYPYPKVRMTYQRQVQGRWVDYLLPATPLPVQAENVYLPNGFECVPLLGCWHLTTQGLNATTYRSQQVLQRLGPIDPWVARAYRILCPNGTLTSPFMYGQSINLYTTPAGTNLTPVYTRPSDVDSQAIYSHVQAPGALSDPFWWKTIAAECGISNPGFFPTYRWEDAFTPVEYAFCSTYGTNDRCSIWPGGGTCSPDWRHLACGR